jgi:streptogramin lyase
VSRKLLPCHLRPIPLAVLALALVSFGASVASALSLVPGDIVVADPEAFGGGGGLIRVDAGTGVQTALSSGGQLSDPVAVAREASGSLVVADASGVVVRVDPLDGSQTLVSTGGNLVQPVGIAVEADGTLLVADAGVDGLIRIDPGDGTQTLFSNGMGLAPAGIGLDASGTIYVTDDFNDRVVEVDPVTGSQTVVAGFPVPGTDFFGDPADIVLDGSNAFVADPTDVSVIEVDLALAANNQSVLSSGGDFCGPTGVAIEAAGTVLVVDPVAFGASCAVDGTGGVIRLDAGVQSVVSTGDLFVDPTGLLVVPVPEPATLLGLAGGLAWLGRRWRRS